MPKYPFSPELLDALPEELAELFRALELLLLEGICSRLNGADQLNEVTVDAIRALRSHGISRKEIEKAIKEYTGISEKKLKRLFKDVVKRNEKYYNSVIDIAKITRPARLVDMRDILAIQEQAFREFRNLTRSMGFLVDAGRTFLPPAKAYQWALDNALMQVQSGAVSYDAAIRGAVKQLADSGLKIADYESEHHDQIDVAARRAILTGVNQINQKYREESMDYLETDLVETTAHSGARDKGTGFVNHKSWQGKVYRWKKYPRTSNGDYPDFDEECRPGDVQGIGGANCRHSYWPFIEGVMERTYTDEELADIDPPPFEYEGRTYTAYEATQKQRMIERTMRKLKREKTAYTAAGLTEDAQAVNIRMRRLGEKYKEFSEAAGLPEQRERMNVLYTDAASEKKAAKLIEANERVLKQEAESAERNTQNPALHQVGKIDTEKFSVVSNKIRTDEVIITEERIQHIKNRHPNDYERYSQYISQMVEDPQYILEDKEPNTAVILQEFLDADERFRLILKLAVEGDNPLKKNSVITFLKISEKTFKKYLRNKNILYKSE